MVVELLRPFVPLVAVGSGYVDVWVKFHGVSLEFMNAMGAAMLGIMVGEPVVSGDDFLYENQFSFMSMKMAVSKSLPLPQRLKTSIAENLDLSFDREYELVFRICERCHQIGHTSVFCD